MNIKNYTPTVTEYYCAPEITKKKNPKLDEENKQEYDPNFKIDITKVLSYSCGKVIKKIFEMRKGN